MNGPATLPPLYAILDTGAADARGIDPEQLLSVWLDAGVQLIQLRAKHWTLGPMLAFADRAVRACEARGARLIINDRADVAALSAAGGVHVGQGDLRPEDARRVVGDGAWVGLSTHSDRQVDAGLNQPITYLAIGPVFQTQSKSNPDRTVGLAGVKSAADQCRARGIPLVAIGGITLDTAPGVLDAGADAVAVISGLLGDDLSRVAARWTRLSR